MRHKVDLSPEHVIKLANQNQDLNFKSHKVNIDMVQEEYKQKHQPTLNPKMSFKEYSETIGAKPHGQLFANLLTEHRDQNEYKRQHEETVKNDSKAFAKKYGEFSHEVERYIDAGKLKRK